MNFRRRHFCGCKRWANRSKNISAQKPFPVGRPVGCRYSFQANPASDFEANRTMTMLRQSNPETTEMLGDLHPLVHQLGSTEGLGSLSTASHSLQLSCVDSIQSLQQFLEAYQAQILIPFELPAIQRAYRHASRNETRELIEFDQELANEVT